MIITVEDGALIEKDPADISVYSFDWDADNLAAGVQISTYLFTITAIKPAGDSALTKDNEGYVTGSSQRKTQLRLTGGTLGATYRIDNRIVTNESPTQQKERSFFLTIQDK